MTVRLYRSTDTGAPQIGTTNDGSLLTILRACLVTGYGSRTAAGWTMPYSDLPNKKAVFKTLAGECLYLDDNIDYRWAEIRAYGSMTSLTEGTERYPDDIQVKLPYKYYATKRYTTSDNYSSWIVVASEEWVYYYNPDASAAQANPSGFFFGQYDCANPSFAHNYILCGVSSTNPTSPSYALFDPSITRYARRNFIGAFQPAALRYEINTINYRNPNPFTGKLELEKFDIRDDQSPYVRYGRLPNCWHLRGNSPQFLRGGETFTVDAIKYIMFCYSGYSMAIEFDTDAA